MASVSIVVVLLIGAAAANAADIGPSPMFVNWLGQQTSPKAKTSNYDELETESVCLLQTKLRNCRCLNKDEYGKCQREYAESTLACCDHEGPGSFMAEKPLMAVCNWVPDYFSTAVDYDGTTTKKIGIFTVKCEMREDSEKCGSPLCEGMSIDGSGDILHYPKVAFIGDAAKDGLFEDTDCDAINRVEPLARLMWTSNVEVPASLQYEERDYIKFYVGGGDIFSGTFRVTSRFHATKFKTGQIQLAYPTNTTALVGVTHEQLPERAYVAKPHQVNLGFIKAAEGY